MGNAAIGALTVALVRTVRGEWSWPAFCDGALGGALAYGGRRLAVSRFGGAGLLGREVGAIGTSMVRNAADGLPALERVVLPVGPVRLHLRTASPSLLPRTVRFQVDVPTVLGMVYLGLRSDTRFDATASVSSGTPVFTTRVTSSNGYWKGTQAAGVIWLRGNPDDPSPDAARAAVLAHERVHVLQYDFGQLLLSDPVEAWLSPRVPGGAWLDRHADLGLHLAPWAIFNWLLPYETRPWEHEAWFLSRVRSGG